MNIEKIKIDVHGVVAAVILLLSLYGFCSTFWEDGGLWYCQSLLSSAWTTPGTLVFLFALAALIGVRISRIADPRTRKTLTIIAAANAFLAAPLFWILSIIGFVFFFHW